MTANIIQALANAETKRYNQAVERLRQAELVENQRHNVAVEGENRRHNLAYEHETNRSNVMNETLKRESIYNDTRNVNINARNADTQRYNASINAYNARTSRASANYNAQLNAMDKLISAANLGYQSKHLRETERHNKAVETETQRNNLVLNGLKEQENKIASQRANTEQWKAERTYEIDSEYVKQGWFQKTGDLVINGAKLATAKPK